MDMANGQAADTGSSVSGAMTSSTQDANTAPVQSNDERVFKQSEVNDIVKRAKYDAVEGFKKISTEQPEYAAKKYGDPSPSSYQQPKADINEDRFRQLAAQEAQRLRDEWVQDAKTRAEADNAQRIVQSFWNKLEPGRQKYEDFDKVTSDIEYSQFPNVVQLLAQHSENAHDVLYHFGEDRIKMAQLEYLCSKSPKDAIVQVKRLSDSLKNNETAKNYRTPKEPLSQMRPTNHGTDNNGALSVKDYRSKYKV